MMIVGGDDIYDFSNQISIVEDCGLRRIGDMPADFAYGACTALETDALLCFSWNDMDGCYRYDGQMISVGEGSNFTHYGTTMGTLGSTAVAVGDFWNKNKKVEHFDDGMWSVHHDFPVISWISDYSMASLNDMLYLFGGMSDAGWSPRAFSYDGAEWAQVGSLFEARVGHRSIVRGNTILHVGGRYNQHFEKWTFNGENVAKIEQLDASLDYYAWYPETFYVSKAFCGK